MTTNRENGRKRVWKIQWAAEILDAAAFYAVIFLRAALRSSLSCFVLSSPLCAWVKRICANLLFYHRSKASLSFALPALEKLRGQRMDIEQLACESSMQALSSLGALLRLPISSAQLSRSITCEGFSEQMLADLRRGRGIVVVSAHIGRWELLVPRIIADLGRRWESPRIAIAYKPLHNKRLDDLLRHIRQEVCGPLCEMVPASGSMDHLSRVLEGGGIVGLVPDQRVARTRQQTSCCSFFGVDLACYDGFARLSERVGWCPVWFVACVDSRPSNRLEQAACSENRRSEEEAMVKDWEGAGLSSGAAAPMHLHARRLDASAGADATVQGLVEAYWREVESVVAMYPAQYLWAHERFKLPKHIGTPPPT